MAIEDYEPKGREKWDKGFDITALDNESKDKVLIRLITKPKSRSGYVGADTVERMVAAIDNEGYDKGVLISNRFTEAARRRLAQEGIKRISDDFMLDFTPRRLYLVARELVDNLCKVKCGKVPQKESDCKGRLNNHYACEVRLLSDNASFHFERGWTSLLQKDTLRLLSMNHSANE